MEQTQTHALRALCATFLKIGAFTFGGGYAMIPMIQREAVETHRWIDETEMLNMIAIAESTPGPIAINTATFIGYKVKGFWGALVATASVVLPSLLVISLVSLVLAFVQHNHWVQSAFAGIRAGVVVLILGAVAKLAKHCKKDLFHLGLILGAFLCVLLFDVNSIYVLLGAGVVGILVQLWRMRRGCGNGGTP